MVLFFKEGEKIRLLLVADFLPCMRPVMSCVFKKPYSYSVLRIPGVQCASGHAQPTHVMQVREPVLVEKEEGIVNSDSSPLLTPNN